MAPLLSDARHGSRTFCVWGNDPIVVVGKRRKGKGFLLHGPALGEGACPAHHARRKGGHALPHVRVSRPRRARAAFQGLPVFLQLRGHGSLSAVQRPGNERHLAQLLPCK